MFNTAAAPEFAEGTLDLASEVWFCVAHETTMQTGVDCAWCVSERMSPAEFDAWLDSHTRG